MLGDETKRMSGGSHDDSKIDQRRASRTPRSPEGPMTSSLFLRRFLAAPCTLAVHLCLARAGLAQQSLAPALFPPEDEVEASDEAYRRGNAASHDKRWADAYEAYRQAWSHHHSMKVAANLGNLELTEGKNRDAAEHLGFAVYAYPKDGDPSVLATLKERLATARA